MAPIYDFCIFGGSFNPVTSGHLLVLYLLQSVNIAHKYLVMPCHINEEKQGLVETEHRIELLNIALKANFPDATNIEVSDFETSYGGTGESYITLMRLKDAYPGKTFIFVIGSDVVPRIPEWSMGMEFAKNADFIIASRGGYTIDKKDLGIFKKYYLLDDLLMEKNMEKKISCASSTEARNLISHGDMNLVQNYLGQDATQYILDHKLYV